MIIPHYSRQKIQKRSHENMIKTILYLFRKLPIRVSFFCSVKPQLLNGVFNSRKKDSFVHEIWSKIFVISYLKN